MRAKAWNDDDVDPIADIKDAIKETKSGPYTSATIDPIGYDDLNISLFQRRWFNRHYKYRSHRWAVRWVGFVYQHSICKGNDMIGRYWWWRFAPFEIRRYRPMWHRFRTIPSERGNLS